MQKVKVDAYQFFSKLLTKENITLVVDKKADTGYFDLNKRILTVPEWSFDNEDFTKMLIAHECAHAIYTPYDGWTKFILSYDKKRQGMAGSYLNIVEDCRIDRLIQERYTGLRSNYTLAAKHEMENDFFKLKKPAQDYDFINRINIHFKTKFYQNGYKIVFTAEEQTYVDRIATLKTWEEVTAITKELIEKFPTTEKSKGLDNFSDTVDETEKSKAEEAEENHKKELKGRYNLSERLFGEKQEDDEECEAIDVAAPGCGEGVETLENLQKSMNSRKANIAISYNVSDGTKILQEPKRIVIKTLNFSSTDTNVSLKTESVMRDYKPWVNLFSAKFEQKKRAREVQKTMFNKTGIIDAQKLHLYRINEEIFRTNTVEEQQKNHAFIVLVDCSSSMASIFGKVTEQFYAMYAVCDRLRIPFKGYGFTTSDYGRRTEGLSYPFSGGSMYGGSLGMYNFFDTDKNKRYNNNVLNYLLSGKLKMGGTPLSDAIFNMIPIIREVKERNHIDLLNFVVLTDGGDGNGNVQSYLNINSRLIKSGLSTRGNYDNTHALYKYLRMEYGINVTTIDVSDNISGSNISSDYVNKFNKTGQVLLQDHGGADNCVVIKTSNANSKNKEVVKILSNILS